MFSLFRRKENLPDVPAWASFFDKSEYKNFIDAIEKYFYKKNVAYTIEDGTLTAGPNDFGFAVMGLSNVAQNCKQSDKSDYYKLISEHFEALLRGNEQAKELDKIIGDFEQVKKYIGVRVYAEEYLDHVGKEKIVNRHVTGELYMTLVLDLPDTIHTVSTEKAQKWNKTNEELLNIGLQNSQNKYDFNISKETIDNLWIWLVAGDHFFYTKYPF